MASSSSAKEYTDAAKQFLLIATLARDRIISNNAKSFLKELAVQKDPKLKILLDRFVSETKDNNSFLMSLHSLIKEESEQFYDDMYFDTSTEIGKSLSKGEREVKKLNENKNLIYGEISFSSFFDILRKLNLSSFREELRNNNNGNEKFTFYDLGSGTGKAVFAARILQDFTSCTGIELLESLHNQAVKIKGRFDSQYRSLLFESANQKTAFSCGSFLDFNWSDGDVVFMNSTCFDEELMSKCKFKLFVNFIFVIYIDTYYLSL
jgi:hypothetical protein